MNNLNYQSSFSSGEPFATKDNQDLFSRSHQDQPNLQSLNAKQDELEQSDFSNLIEDDNIGGLNQTSNPFKGARDVTFDVHNPNVVFPTSSGPSSVSNPSTVFPTSKTQSSTIPSSSGGSSNIGSSMHKAFSNEGDESKEKSKNLVLSENAANQTTVASSSGGPSSTTTSAETVFPTPSETSSTTSSATGIPSKTMISTEPALGSTTSATGTVNTTLESATKELKRTGQVIQQQAQSVYDRIRNSEVFRWSNLGVMIINVILIVLIAVLFYYGVY
ncbi:hypothetical protein FDP41_013740 [Naegleria fowleri]|uniref:Uncharacterized protein n=1 Tax=Naegleria fowleri TaxID=5763 RepID=A0A6A5BYR1_NAEFO|nr:uncharacterized protein FDP41_013740 [Naegleria fowleri]KAF0980526.1 hypothetical protein FDP41_013740 [Naegleria fowleri]CAG4708226.1 unnamed protein product [Naegleria fowleri]